MPLSDASPSLFLTSSVDSAKSIFLPSLKESDLVIKPPQFKSNISHIKQPSIRRMSTSDMLHCPLCLVASPLPSPSKTLANNWNTEVSKLFNPQYHPYTPRISHGLHYTAQSLRILSPSDVTLQEVEKVCCMLHLPVSYLTYR